MRKQANFAKYESPGEKQMAPYSLTGHRAEEGEMASDGVTEAIKRPRSGNAKQTEKMRGGWKQHP